MSGKTGGMPGVAGPSPPDAAFGPGDGLGAGDGAGAGEGEGLGPLKGQFPVHLAK